MTEKVKICNYIQTKLNEVGTKKMRDNIGYDSIEESIGYKKALLQIKKGLIRRELWETTVKEEYKK